MKASDIELADDIRTVGKNHVADLADITADAFRNDPFNSWLWDSHEAMHRVFAILAKHVYAPRGFCQILNDDGEDRAAAMWMLPGGNLKTSVAGTLSMFATLLRFGGITAVQRGLAAGAAMEKNHLKEPHAYLFTVGVRATGRGRGLGRKLLIPVLEACDRTRTTVYLENSNPDNRRFYNSLGFERVSLFHPVPGCPPLEAMRREA